MVLNIDKVPIIRSAPKTGILGLDHVLPLQRPIKNVVRMFYQF